MALAAAAHLRTSPSLPAMRLLKRSALWMEPNPSRALGFCDVRWLIRGMGGASASVSMPGNLQQQGATVAVPGARNVQRLL